MIPPPPSIFPLILLLPPLHRRYPMTTGECLDDKRFGFGIFRFPDGKTYEGEWVKDKVHGGGILRAPDGTIIDE